MFENEKVKLDVLKKRAFNLRWAEVDEGIISLFERGEYVNPIMCNKITYNVEQYIRSFDRKKYLTTRIIEETLLQVEDEADHRRTLSHLQIHVAKLNMMYL